jgi:hypothetical protein
VSGAGCKRPRCPRFCFRQVLDAAALQESVVVCHGRRGNRARNLGVAEPESASELVCQRVGVRAPRERWPECQEDR